MITARIRRMTKGNTFRLFTPAGGYPHSADGRYPHLADQEGGVPPSFLAGMGYPILPDWGWDWMGVPPSQVRRQSSRASTCYAAGGMPLAFTQEDFLVLVVFFLVFLGFLNTLISPKIGIC